MVAHYSMRTYGVNQEFRFDKGIWLHRKSGQIRFFFLRKIPFLHHACATFYEQPSNIKTMVQPLNGTAGNLELDTKIITVYRHWLLDTAALFNNSFLLYVYI